MYTLQEAAIDTLGKLSKRVWLKLDATDMKTALQQSQTGEWNGDADLGDGKLEDLRELYNGRMHTVTLITSRNRQTQMDAMTELMRQLTDDIQFLAAGLQQSI